MPGGLVLVLINFTKPFVANKREIHTEARRTRGGAELFGVWLVGCNEEQMPNLSWPESQL